jgi:transposase
MTTKILALVDALGNLVHFVLLPGQRFDTIGVEPLIEGINFGALLGDKAFDSNSIIAALNKRGAKIVISQHPRRAQPLKIDQEMYKWRHLIENFFCKLKEFKRIAMRCDKTDQSFAAMIYLAAAVINSRWISTDPNGGSSADRITARRPSMTGGECGACRAHWPFSFPFSAPLRARLPSTIMANEKFAARPSCCKLGPLRRVEQCVPNCPFSAGSAACLLLPPSLAPWRWRPR